MKSPPPPLAEMDPDAPPSAEELREAGELRDALADPSLENDEAALARALVLADRPRDLEKSAHAALVAGALAQPRREANRGPAAVVLPLGRRRSGRAWAVAGASVLALAASMLFFQSSQESPMASLDREALPAHVRSAQSLFQEPFSAQGGTSARIDRIARARARDLRENRFAQWDVR